MTLELLLGSWARAEHVKRDPMCQPRSALWDVPVGSSHRAALAPVPLCSVTVMPVRLRVVALFVLAVFVVAACAPDPAEELTGEAAIGRSVAQRAGCMSCHGANGEGGSGPKFIGLADSMVTLKDGTRLLADDAYLAEATTNPAAKITAGSIIVMPANALTAVEVAEVVAYIRALKVSTAPSK